MLLLHPVAEGCFVTYAEGFEEQVSGLPRAPLLAPVPLSPVPLAPHRDNDRGHTHDT